MEWTATIPGPLGTPFEGGLFDLEIKFPEEYPFKPPSVKFLTQIYHCNVSSSGNVCLSLFDKDNWNPMYDIGKILMAMEGFMVEQNPADPYRGNIATELLNNPKKYHEEARRWVGLYA